MVMLASVLRRCSRSQYHACSILARWSSSTPGGQPYNAEGLQQQQQQQQDPEVEERKRAAVRAYMASQLGGEKHAQLAQLLQAHGVVVKGGPEEAKQLLNALIAWKEERQDGQQSADAKQR